MFNLSSGKLAWQVDPTINGCYGTSQPVVVHGYVITAIPEGAACTRSLEARALSDGHLVWSRPDVGDPQRGDNDTTSGTDVFAVGPSGTLTDIVAATGATRWSRGSTGDVLAVDAARVYTHCGTNVCAWARSTGNPVWNSNGYMTAPVTIAGPVLYSNTFAFDAATGTLITQVVTSGVVSAVANGRLIVLDDGRTIDGSRYYDNRIIDVYGLPGF